jgi:gliding motility-associated-like protein
MSTILICSALLLCCNTLFAQGENNYWCIGNNKAINFNTSNFSLSTNSLNWGDNVGEASDAAGNLLFYIGENGKVWNKHHQLMPNSPIISTPNSSIQYIQILGAVNNPLQYYVIFISNDNSNPLSYQLNYTLIDMSLDNSLGDIVLSEKNIVLIPSSENNISITRAHDACAGYWLVIHRAGTQYEAYKLDANGFSNQPVISQGLLSSTNHTFNFNNTGTRIVNAARYHFNYYYTPIETAEFNATTGQFTNFKIMVTDSDMVWGPFVFSPDDTKLYTKGTQNDNNPTLLDYGLVQFNIALLPNTNAVQNSLVRLAPRNTNCIQPRLGPDGKIYFASTYSGFCGLSVVNQPNVLGTACHFDSLNLFPTSPNTITFTLLGNNVILSIPSDTVYQHHTLDTILCLGSPITLTADTSYQTRLWSTNSTSATETITQSGTYWLKGRRGCTLYIDTFKVHYQDNSFHLPEDTLLCQGDSLLLQAHLPANSTIVWNNGSTASLLWIQEPGSYYATVTTGGCIQSDTIVITQQKHSLTIKEPDTTICEGMPLTLQALAEPSSFFKWNTGETTDTLTINKAGTYQVTAQNICGTFTDAVVIQQQNCCTPPWLPTAFSPNNDGLNDALSLQFFCPLQTEFYWSIYNKYGENVFETHNPQAIWNGYYKGKLCDMGTYAYVISYKENNSTKRFSGTITLLH